MTSQASIPESTSHGTIGHAIEVIHYADPWCWWSWGLEPVLRRLKEVYGDQISIIYRMGGISNQMDQWRKEYDVVADQALRTWINQSIAMTGMPTDPEYILKTKIQSTWPACIAFKAAQLQSEELAERFFRKLMEAIQVEAKNGSNEEEYLQVAKEVGLDPSQLMRDISSGRAGELFEKDKGSMNVNFLTLVLVNAKNNKQEVVGDAFTSEPYEKAVDRLSDGTLKKRTPIDILAYVEQNSGFLVSARELAVIFGITVEEAQNRLSILEKRILKRRDLEFGGSFWTLSLESRLSKLTMEELKAAHVTEGVKATSETDFSAIITSAVQNLYTEVASNPTKAYHFPLGRKAALFVGYPEEEIEKIPATAVESFAGVGYPHAANAITPGDSVLDIGSGSGTDVLIASLHTGPKGTVTGLDITDAMIEKARSNIAKMGAKNVKIVKGGATAIPLDDESIDVVTSNGVLNLVPGKEKAFHEIYRVLKRGGRLQLADIVVEKDVQKACGLIPQLWADCIGGAAVEDDYLGLVKSVGFEDVRIVNRLDYFSESSSDNTKRLTQTFGAQTIVLSAIKPR